MNVALEQPHPVVSDRLRDRLIQLGLPLVRLTADGSCRPLTRASWFEHKLFAWPGFNQALHSHWPAIASNAGHVVQVMPGIIVLPLTAKKRRRISESHGDQPQVAVVFLGPMLTQSEQLHQLCAFYQLDHHSTVERICRANLIDADEAARLSNFILWMHQDSADVDRRTLELQLMGQELAESYEELSLLYKLSTNMTVDQSPAAFLTEACHELQQVLEVNWIALQLTSDEPRLEDLAGQNFTAGQVDHAASLKRLGRELLARFGASDEPIIVDDASSLNLPDFDRLATTLLIVPLHLQGKPLGVLFAGDKTDHAPISSIDSKLCDSLSNSLTIFLDNMMLYEDMHAMFLGTLHALTAAIDAKDSYTHGHSERVALMSQMLAEAAGLDQHTCQRVYVAGLVHDVGKIGVPEAVLCKPGKLTDDEFRLIKRHPEIGARILQDIRQMRDLIPGVLYHHERWDGRGYPHQLAGQNIPLFGRLIGLADAFDAMSSNRTYRRALASTQVLDEIVRCAGQQFDPTLTQAFIKLDFDPFHDLIEQHQNQRVKRSA